MAARVCANCNEQSEDAKRCAGCRNVWYCSAQCQGGHWTTHIFDCKTAKPIDTVYYLYRAACRGLVPLDARHVDRRTADVEWFTDVPDRVRGAVPRLLARDPWAGT